MRGKKIKKPARKANRAAKRAAHELSPDAIPLRGFEFIADDLWALQKESKMKKLFGLICLCLILAVAMTVPANACNWRCEHNECVEKSFTTNQDCHMSGFSCIDDPVWGCSAPKERANVTLGDIYNDPQEVPLEAGICAQ